MIKTILFSMALFASTAVEAQDIFLPDIPPLSDIKGNEINLKELFKNHSLVILVFWSIGHNGSINVLDIINLHNKFKNLNEKTNMKLFAVCCSEDDFWITANVKPLVEEKDWWFDVLIDSENNLKWALNVTKLPRFFIVKDGRITDQFLDYQTGDEQKLYKIVKQYTKTK